jgi:hypothetical protein
MNEDMAAKFLQGDGPQPGSIAAASPERIEEAVERIRARFEGSKGPQPDSVADAMHNRALSQIEGIQSELKQTIEMPRVKQKKDSQEWVETGKTVQEIATSTVLYEKLVDYLKQDGFEGLVDRWNQYNETRRAAGEQDVPKNTRPELFNPTIWTTIGQVVDSMASDLSDLTSFYLQEQKQT